MSSPETNSVKVISMRQAFLNDVMRHMIPGTYFSIDHSDSQRSAFFTNKIYVYDLDLPEANKESVLTKWKIKILKAGATKPQIMSAASLMRFAGYKLTVSSKSRQSRSNDSYGNKLTIHGNLFDPVDGASSVRSLKRELEFYVPGPRTRKKSVLVGNLYEAEQWARATKMGKPIIFSDESGVKHRAIEIKPGPLGVNTHFSMETMPVRLNHPMMIQSFIQKGFEQFELDGKDRFDAATSFKGAVKLDGGKIVQDLFSFSPKDHAIGFLVAKTEREKFVRSLRSAFARDKALWQKEHPVLDEGVEVTYPIEFRTHSKRTSKDNPKVFVMMSLPEDPLIRKRYLKVLLSESGLQLYVPTHYGLTARLAKEAESEYHNQITEILQEQRAAKILARERREEMKQSLELAFEGSADALPVIEVSANT